MNKNTIIGLLVVIVLLGIGYYIVKDNDEVAPVVYNTSTNNTTSTEPTVTENMTAGAPVVMSGNESGVSSSTATVTGRVRPNGASTTYWFEYGTTDSLGSRTQAQSLGSGFSLISTTGFITGLSSNTSYYFRLSAQNSFGTVNGQILTFKTNDTVAPRISLPNVRTNDATKNERTTAVLNGEVNPNGFATNYWFEYGTDNNFGNVTAFQATNSGTSYMSVPTSISGLKPLTKYYFRLNAQNQFGTVNGSTKTFSTPGPGVASAPTAETLQAKSISSSDAVFVGKINPNGSDTSYWFEYSTDSLLGSLIGTGTPKGTIMGGTTTETVQINVNGLQSNTKYYYHLVARNDQGTVNGKIMSFTTKR